MTSAVEAFIGLGSNLQHPRQQLRRALQALAVLPHTQLLGSSGFYGSAPLGPQDQPDYVNAVAQLQTALSPLDLLDALQAIELAQGRERKQHWGARTLDLDVLLYGDRSVNLPRLQVPHPHMWQRAFVLAPLAELAPQLSSPEGVNIQQALLACEQLELQRFQD